MKKLLLPIITLFCLCLFAYQADGQKECDVLHDGLKDTYDGNCKKGLAHGVGKATGKLGLYEGSFRKGLPDGNGKLRYADGAYFDGTWDKGLRDGKGKFVSSNNEVTEGYWKDDEYQGKYKKPYEYRVVRGNLPRLSFNKRNDFGKDIELTFLRDGQRSRAAVSGLLVQSSSSILNDSGITFTGFQNVEYPFEAQVDFTYKPRGSALPTDVRVEFTIYEEGDWVVNFMLP